MLTRLNAKAVAVLAALYQEPGINVDELHIEAYVNGREHGFMVYDRREYLRTFRKTAFSENRNSDSIVVYFGVGTDFSMQGNVPNDECYRNRVFFDPDAYAAAAKAIALYINPNGEE